MLEMLQKMNMLDVGVDKFITMNRGEDTVYEVDLFVRNVEQLEKVFLELNKLPYVTKVERLMR